MFIPSAPSGAQLCFGAIILWCAICVPAAGAICSSAPDIGAQTHHSAQLLFHNSIPMTPAQFPTSLALGINNFSKESVWVGIRSIFSSAPATEAQKHPSARFSSYNSISLTSVPLLASLALGTFSFSKESVWAGKRSICSSAPVTEAQNYPFVQLSSHNTISPTSALFPASPALGNTRFSKESAWGENRSISLHTHNYDAPNDPSALLTGFNSLPWNVGPLTASLPAGKTSFTESAGLGNLSISPLTRNSDVFYDNIKLPSARMSHWGTSENPLLFPVPVALVLLESAVRGRNLVKQVQIVAERKPSSAQSSTNQPPATSLPCLAPASVVTGPHLCHTVANQLFRSQVDGTRQSAPQRISLHSVGHTSQPISLHSVWHKSQPISLHSVWHTLHCSTGCTALHCSTVCTALHCSTGWNTPYSSAPVCKPRAAAGSADQLAAPTARLSVIETEAESLATQMDALNASTPGSWRARMLTTQLTTLMAEANVLEGQIQASQQIHPPG